MTAILKGIGTKELAFCSILARSNSEFVLEFCNCNKLISLSLTSGKCVPIMVEASSLEIPFFNPKSLNREIPINLKKRNNSTTINNQNNTVLYSEENQKKYSNNRVEIKYNKPIQKNNKIPFINSFV